MPVAETIFVLVVLLGIAMLVTGLCRKMPIPFTVVLVVIGVLLSNLAETWPLLHPLRGERRPIGPARERATRSAPGLAPGALPVPADFDS